MSAAEQALASGDAVPLSLRGPAATRIVAGYGFWDFACNGHRFDIAAAA